jgi:predicted RND superfamily exporter protein
MNKNLIIALVAIEIVLIVLSILGINLKFIDTPAIAVAIPMGISYLRFEDSRSRDQ